LIRKIQISNENKIPIYLQIAEQIKAIIGGGELNEGDLLPGRQALARQLGVNINTINYTFRVLENEGFICSKRGVGSFVLKRTENENKTELLNELRNQLTDVKRKAINYGFSRDQFLRLVEECLHSETESPGPTALFVECHQAWTDAGASELERALGIKVERVVIPDGEELVQEMVEKIRAADIVITTHPHFNEIRNMVGPNKFVFPLDQHVSYEMITKLASMRDARIAVPFLKASTVKRLGLSIKAAACQVNLVPVHHKDMDDLAKKVMGYSALLLPPNHVEEVRALVAGDVTIVPIESVLGERSVQYLKESLSKLYGGFGAT